MMSRISAVLLLAGLAFAAMFASWSAGGSSSSDCTTYTATPTNSPTPAPTPPWEPYSWVPICNDSGQAVSDLHIRLVRSADNEDPIGANAPGCPEPAYFFGGSPPYTTIDIDWGTPCVHPGEMVTLYFFAGCTTPEPGCSPPNVSCYYWTLDGAPAPSANPAPNPPTCANPSPIPTATPQPTGPCPARGTPPVTYAPTPTPATPTPTPGPTSRDMIWQTTITFCSDAGESASDFHVHFAFPYSGRTFKGNPTGCPEPSFEPAHYPLDTFDLDVDWGVACVDPGESLTLEFTYACGDVPCNTPQPFCYTWTRFGAPLYHGQGDCDLPPPTQETFTNRAGISADGLHFFALGGAQGLNVSVLENAPGCAWGTASAGRAGETIDFTYEVHVNFSGACVDDGESVTVGLACPAVAPCVPGLVGDCVDWTLAGSIIGTPCPTPNCNGGPCCRGLPCPTLSSPTPPVDVTVWTFRNDTGQPASGLYAEYTWPFHPSVVENAPGCPEPTLTVPGSYPRNFFDLDWGDPCVDPGESLQVEITSEPPAMRSCFHWTLAGDPLTLPADGGCQLPGDIDCDGGVDTVDGLNDLRFVAGLALNLPAKCDFRGDVDCDEDVDSVDALSILRYLVGMPVRQEDACAPIGAWPGSP